jgi:hypothetical protein
LDSMCSLQWGAGNFPCLPLFSKVDTVVVSMYNKGLEIMLMGETWLLCIGLFGVIVGILESIRGDVER